MKQRQRGWVLKSLCWMIGLAALALAAVFGINATDEELSDLAKKAMAVPPAPPLGPDNGYADFLALDSASLDDQLKRVCSIEPSCLKHVADNPHLVQLSIQAKDFAARYLTMRGKPLFVDLHDTNGPDDLIPGYGNMIWGQGRSLIIAANLANQGKLEAAVAELEVENAFHRRVASGARSLLVKVVALSCLNNDALFASELARVPGRQSAALLGRLKAIVRPLADAESDMRKVVELERALMISWMRTRNFVRLSDEHYRVFSSYNNRSESRPWWDPVAPYLYRPHQSVNRYAAQIEILLRVAAMPPKDFAAGAAAAEAEAKALLPRGLARELVNPVGTNHPLLAVTPAAFGDSNLITPYIGRAHVTQALYTLVTLQIALRQAGVAGPSAIERALDGPLFKAHPDPFTGQPMLFDAKTRTIGFDPPVRVSAAIGLVRERYGRIAVELAVKN